MKKKPTTPPPELERLIAEYAAAYPGVNTFIVTTDRLVFLPRQSAEAAEHQKTLNSKNKMNAPGGSPAIQIYKRPAAAGKNK